MDDLHDRMEHDLTNHPPTPEQVERMERLRDHAKGFAHELINSCPPGRELSVALTSVEQACMYGVAAIARER